MSTFKHKKNPKNSKTHENQKPKNPAKKARTQIDQPCLAKYHSAKNSPKRRILPGEESCGEGFS
jgi:hypothetical protein